MANISIDHQRLSDFCRKNHIQRLAFYGSVLRDDFGPESDIDVLVEFDSEHIPGLFKIAGFERALSEILGNRKVDLRTAEDLSRYFRQDVLDEAEVLYAQG